MNGFAARFAQAAERYAGVRYRLHGRDRAYGVDCAGLVAAALEDAGREARLPQNYALRNRSMRGWAGAASLNGFAASAGPVKRGDVLLFLTGPAQFHVAIATASDRIVHAHAGLRRVAVQPLPAEWHIAGHWRAIE